MNTSENQWQLVMFAYRAAALWEEIRRSLARRLLRKQREHLRMLSYEGSWTPEVRSESKLGHAEVGGGNTRSGRVTDKAGGKMLRRNC
jgi:hypothetical protein